MLVEKTDRGFRLVSHQEPSCEPMTLAQESSAIGEYSDAMGKPGSSFLWINGCHLNREQVAFFAGCLQKWLETGKLLPKEE